MNHTRRARVPLALLATVLSAVLSTPSLQAQPTSQPAMTLRQAAEPSGVLVGTAVMARSLDEPAFANLVGTQFNSLTAENEFKPAAIQNEKGRFTFEAADRIASFAQQHRMTLIGHTLLWHASSPRWMFQDGQGNPLPREAALENLRTHITTVMQHYRGKVVGWDVVNEAIADGGNDDLRDTPARRAIGDDYVLRAFEFARAADPDAKLYYNDYNIEMPYKRARAVRLVTALKEANLIDGVGIQGHWLLDSPDLTTIEEGIDAFQKLGLPVMITELDVDPLPRRGAGADVNATEAGADPYKQGLPADVSARLAQRYGEIVSLLQRRRVERITLWGVHDGATWLNGFPVRGRTNHPLLFDRQLQPKPAFDAFVEALKPRP